MKTTWVMLWALAAWTSTVHANDTRAPDAPSGLFDCQAPPGPAEHVVPGLVFKVTRCPTFPALLPHPKAKDGALRLDPGMPWQQVADAVPELGEARPGRPIRFTAGDAEPLRRVALSFRDEALFHIETSLDAEGARRLEAIWGRPLELSSSLPRKVWFNRQAGIKAVLSDLAAIADPYMVERNDGRLYVLEVYRYVPLRERFAAGGLFSRPFLGEAPSRLHQATKGDLTVAEHETQETVLDESGKPVERVTKLTFLDMLGSELDGGKLSFSLTLSDSGSVIKASFKLAPADPETIFAALGEIRAGMPGVPQTFDVDKDGNVTATFDVRRDTRLTLRSSIVALPGRSDVAVQWLGELTPLPPK